MTGPEQSGLHEAGHLIGQLARHRDWAGLWRLVLGMPLADAAAAMPAFGDGWRPSDDPGRVLFGRLASAGPDTLAMARDALGGARALSVPVHGLPQWCAFSPDGRQLVILSIDAGLLSGEVCVVRLPGGVVVDRQEVGFYPLKVLHLGDAILVSGETVTGERRYNPAGPPVLLRLAQGRAEPVLMPGSWGGLQYHPCGFALHGRSRADGSRLLRLCAPDGEVIRDIPLGGLGGPDLGAELIGCDPADGRLVLNVGSDGLLILNGLDDRVLARGGVRHRVHFYAHFADGDLLLAQTARHVWSYRLAGGRLKRRAMVKNLAFFGPVLIPELGAVAVTGARGVRLLAATATLPRAGKKPGITGIRADGLFGSRDGRYLAVTRLGERCVTIVRSLALAALAAAPMADMTAADMVTTSDLLRDPATVPAGRPFLELLRDCLAYRLVRYPDRV
jgi:hypothetical protein